MQIAEITQRLPTFIARLRVRGLVISSTITAANLMQAHELLKYLYGLGNVLTVERFSSRSYPFGGGAVNTSDIMRNEMLNLRFSC